MIAGKVKKQLNEFELELDTLVGNHIDNYGATHYFDLLHETFLRATKHLQLDSKIFHYDLQKEDPEINRSIIQSQESIAYPLLSMLYNSYFITVHSELESMWKEATQIFNKYHPDYSFPEKLNSQYFLSFSNKKKKKKKFSFIDEVVLRHQILFTYNYIRNGIIHAKKSKECDEFKTLKEKIESHVITDIEILDVENGFIFSIKKLDFVKKYEEEVLSLFHELIEYRYL